MQKFSDILTLLRKSYSQLNNPSFAKNIRSEEIQTFAFMMSQIDISKDFLLYKFAPGFSKELIKAKIDFELEQFGDEPFRAALQIEGRFVIIHFRPGPGLTPSGKLAAAMLYCYGVRSDLQDFHFVMPLGGDFGSLSSSLPQVGERNEFSKVVSVEEEWKICANAIAYLRSGNPDLRDYKPPGKETPKRERDRIVQAHGTEPCILVSWGWKKPIISHTDAWDVEGHFFWAAVGAGRTKRALTWREGHQRQRQPKKE